MVRGSVFAIAEAVMTILAIILGGLLGYGIAIAALSAFVHLGKLVRAAEDAAARRPRHA